MSRPPLSVFAQSLCCRSYPIKGDKIGGISIRYQFNDDELWTRAAKFMLTNCKWLIAIEGHLRSKAAAESAERSRSAQS